MKTDWLIVGAGFTGCTLGERIATQLGQKVVIIDSRAHLGGNAFDYSNNHGIRIHQYGPHLFHTNSKAVWGYLSQFTDWHPYSHHVLGVVEGKKVPLPFNLNSLQTLFPLRKAQRLQERLLKRYGLGARVPILKLKEAKDPELLSLAQYIYENVFAGYTQKQWGMSPEDLDPSVTARVPVLVSHDNRYFHDTHQAMPLNGYSSLFSRMLDHSNIAVLLNTPYSELRRQVEFRHMIYTGQIDEFFNFKYGALGYRSLRFEFQTLQQEWFQEVGTVNYPNHHDFTRITEPKHFGPTRSPATTTITEYPQPHIPGQTIPYYPIPNSQNQKQYALYQAEAKQNAPNVIFAGRLGEYRYYNMDQAVARALKLFREKATS